MVSDSLHKEANKIESKIYCRKGLTNKNVRVLYGAGPKPSKECPHINMGPKKPFIKRVK
jgi:hypothetical protein